MEEPGIATRADLSDTTVRVALPHRREPYWSLLAYSRHLGYQKRGGGSSFWMARLRTNNGKYKQRRLGEADREQEGGLTHADALALARSWFDAPLNRACASEAFPVGVRQDLIICPIGDEFSVGHALYDYVEWKRIAAARSHFETNLSMINYHIIPRLADTSLEAFNGLDLRHFARAVLETPPKRGGQIAGPRRAISGCRAARSRQHDNGQPNLWPPRAPNS